MLPRPGRRLGMKKVFAASIVLVGVVASIATAMAATGEPGVGPPGLEAARLGAIPAEPQEFIGRPRLPLCGAERPAAHRLAVRRDPAARRCLRRAWRRELPAELVSVIPTIEGPVLAIYRVVGDG